MTFNNLLTVITGNVDLLREAGKVTADEKLESILRASLRGGELIERMLAFSRRQTLQPKPTDINRLIGNTPHLLARTLGENIGGRHRR
jgi:signal transduction histidine kinase